MVDEVEEKTRVCVKCRTDHPIEFFYRTGWGRRRDCKFCCTEYAKPRSKRRYHEIKNTDEYKAKKRARQRRNRSRLEVWEKDKAWSRQHRLKRLDSEKKSQMKTKYGLTMERYWEMMKEQDSKCAICSRNLVARAEKYCAEVACVDHCHKTGRVRALLCGPCNVGLGSLGDDPVRLEAAASYLRRYA